GSWKTVASRFYRWQAPGIWKHILTRLQQQSDATGQLDWSLHFVDGTIVRAHQHAAGARKGGGDEALGGSRGGFRAKTQLGAEGGGKPMVVLLTAGQWHEQRVFTDLMEVGAIPRPHRGRPRIRPERVAGDKGYSGRRLRRYLRRRGIASVIPRQARERRTRFD